MPMGTKSSSSSVSRLAPSSVEASRVFFTTSASIRLGSRTYSFSIWAYELRAAVPDRIIGAGLPGGKELRLAALKWRI
jgi:hypothetical protein